MSEMFVNSGGGALDSEIAMRADALVLNKEKKAKEKRELKRKVEAFKWHEEAKKILEEQRQYDCIVVGKPSKWKMNGEGHSKITGKPARLKKWQKLKNIHLPAVKDPGEISDGNAEIPSVDDAIVQMKKEYVLPDTNSDRLVEKLAKLGKNGLRPFVEQRRC